MNSKESALHDAINRALNQYTNYWYKGCVLRAVKMRELIINNCLCYLDESETSSPLSPEQWEHAKYCNAAEIRGMIDFKCDNPNILSGSRSFEIQSISFEVTYDCRNCTDFFIAKIINEKIAIAFI